MHRARPRLCSFRLFDIAASLYVYLFAFHVAGVHTYRSLERNPQPSPPPLPELVEQARAAVDAAKEALGDDGPLPDKALQDQLDAADYDRVQRLRTFQDTATSDPPRLELFDEAIYLSERVGKRGRALAEGKETQRLGRTLVLRSAESQWRMADAMRRAWEREDYWSQGQEGLTPEEDQPAEPPPDDD